MKPLVLLAVLLGILFIGVGVYYFMTPAGSLPTYFPGYEAASTHIHLKHGVAGVVLGLCSFVYAWFHSKPTK